MLVDLEERLAKFGVSLHEDKTRLIEFGRLPAQARRQRSERQPPETFAFLGFTHYCGWTRDGRFIVKLKTQSKRLTRKLKALRQEAWRLMHLSTEQLAKMTEWVEQGPNFEQHGVTRWRCVDLQKRIREEFSVELQESTVS